MWIITVYETRTTTMVVVRARVPTPEHDCIQTAAACVGLLYHTTCIYIIVHCNIMVLRLLCCDDGQREMWGPGARARSFVASWRY